MYGGFALDATNQRCEERSGRCQITNSPETYKPYVDIFIAVTTNNTFILEFTRFPWQNFKHAGTSSFRRFEVSFAILFGGDISKSKFLVALRSIAVRAIVLPAYK